MIVIKDAKELEGKEIVATIGFFDGVHLGHRHLINEMKEVADLRNLPSAVITFPVHPRIVLHADYQPNLLNSFEEKINHLAETGIDYCIVLDFTTELAALSAKEFMHSVLVEKLHVKALLVGYDHRFGHNRTDGFDAYSIYGKELGIDMIKASSYSEKEMAISSSEIRRRLRKCQIEQAARLLTYPYQLKGKIVGGYKVGRKLGFPTANIEVDEPFKIMPGIGVYAVWVEWEQIRYKGMLYIGDRPTLTDNGEITLEVNILDFEGDLYNKEITVFFIYHVRGDIKFNSLDALKEQLKNDRETVNKLLS